MKRYDERILRALLDKYERSLLYTGKNQVNQTIAVSIQKKLLPEYFDESALQFEVIHQQLEVLEEQGYVRLVWKNKKRGHILEKCELVVDHAGAAYQLLRRKPKCQKEDEILEICEQYHGKVQGLDDFLTWVNNRISSGETVRKYVDVDTPQEFRKLCELIFRILTNEEECFLRQFSIRYFHDSKIAEKEIGKAAHIIAEFCCLNGLQTEEILEEYNIYRNPSWLMMKGNVSFFRQNGEWRSRIDLSAFCGGIGISNQDIEEISWNRNLPMDWVVTIENLTSFHQFMCPKMENKHMLILYLGGYHNHMKREFLKKLYAAYPKAEYVHFGDIDCGGFRIWKDLCVKTGIPFRTIYMDEKTYDRYQEWGRPLTQTDRKTLSEMLEDSFFDEQSELFLRMLECGVKIEQECVEQAENKILQKNIEMGKLKSNDEV